MNSSECNSVSARLLVTDQLQKQISFLDQEVELQINEEEQESSSFSYQIFRERPPLFSFVQLGPEIQHFVLPAAGYKRGRKELSGPRGWRCSDQCDPLSCSICS
jgi:hypothetical protein